MSKVYSEGETLSGDGGRPKKDGNGPFPPAFQMKYMKHYRLKGIGKHPLPLNTKDKTGTGKQGGELQKSEADAINQDQGA